MAFARATTPPALVGWQVSQWANFKPALVAGIILAAVAWQLVAPIFGNRPCGLIVPHEHVLVGAVDAHDLALHEAAETACAAGKMKAPKPQTADPHGRNGQILNVIQIAGGTAAHVISIDGFTGSLPISTDIQVLHPFYTRLDTFQLPVQPIMLAPPNPPPEAV